MTKIATALQRDAKKNSEPRFRAGETQILTSGVPFSVALRSKKRGGQKKAPRSKRLYPYRKNPSVRHTVWGKIKLISKSQTNFLNVFKIIQNRDYISNSNSNLLFFLSMFYFQNYFNKKLQIYN